jgi:hypothetical protein
VAGPVKRLSAFDRASALIENVGRAIISSRETAIKVKNLKRDPDALLCVFENRWPTQ